MMKFPRILATLILSVLPFAFVGAQEIRDVSITAVLSDDGSARITQVWDVTVTSGTEWYIPIENLGKMTVSDLTVSENGQRFISEGDSWNVDRSIEQKAGRCGIVRKRNGVELCWGQGSYGSHVWTASFTVSGLVQSLNDADAFNFMFLNPGLVAPPQHAIVTIVNNTGSRSWTSSNTKVWGFGTQGEINVVDGKVVMETLGPMSYSESMIAMVRFDKGLFSPTVSRDIDFETMRNEAFEGSQYTKDKGEWILFLFAALFFFIPVAALVYCIVCSILGYKYRKSLFGTSKIKGWFREAPLDDNLPACYYILSKAGRFGNTDYSKNLIGAYFLKWILEGRVRTQTSGKKGKRVDLIFPEGEENIPEGTSEKLVYNMAVDAAGANRILETDEFQKWSQNNAQRVIDFPSKVLSEGKSFLLEKNLLKGAASATSEGMGELTHVIEFKNFLNDFTLIPERSSSEVGLWKSYLIYGQIFGIASKVAQEFKKLYPAEFAALEQSVGTPLSRNIIVLDSMSRNSYGGAYTKLNSYKAGSYKGGGGHISFGGGGGFSGGGFGGGSR